MLYQLRYPAALLGIAVALIVGLLVHDAAQTLAAQALGDATPRRQGRLSAPAAARIDPFGAVAAVVAGYGWGSEVPLEQRWRARRRRVALALAAGPMAYFVLALLALIVVRAVDASGDFALVFAQSLAFTFAAQGVLSLVPLPPLDGGRIMLVLAPQTLGWQKARYQLEERNLGTALALAVVLLPRLFTGLAGADVVQQLAPELLRGLAPLVGL